MGRTGTSTLMEAIGQARATPMIVLVLPGPGDKLKVEVKHKDVRVRVGRSRPDLAPAN